MYIQLLLNPNQEPKGLGNLFLTRTKIKIVWVTEV